MIAIEEKEFGYICLNLPKKNENITSKYDIILHQLINSQICPSLNMIAIEEKEFGYNYVQISKKN